MPAERLGLLISCTLLTYLLYGPNLFLRERSDQSFIIGDKRSI